MRKYLFLGVLLGCTALSHAQNIPNGVNNPAAATARPLPYQEGLSPYFVRSITPILPVQDPYYIKGTTSVDTAIITTQFFDYLHRPLQTVSKQSSPTKKDNVAVMYYDEFNRASTQYLPYTAQTGNTDDGKFKLNAFAADSAFYKMMFPNESINYAQQVYDGSPLNRVVKQMNVGNSFTGAGIGKTATWRANTLADSVVLWTIPIVSEDDLPTKFGIYAAGSLMVQEATDEKGIKTIVYADEIGRTILVKKQLATTPSTGHAGWLCTYYVYDEMNHVRMMLPPKAVELLNGSNFVVTTAIATGLCYSYYYDVRGRNTIKRIPGKGKFYTAYDVLDRVVMSQDPNLRTTNRWAFVLYDGQDRAVKSGLITTALTKDQVFAQAAVSNNYPTLSGTYTITSEAYFDDYSWIAASGTTLSTTLTTTNINSSNFITNYNTAPEYAQPITQSKRIRGMPTGTKKLILNSTTYLYSVSYYDDYGRAIQTAQTNYTGGTDVTTVQYSFTGKSLRSHIAQQKAGTNAQTNTVLTKYVYDHVGRVKTISKQFNNLAEKVLAQYNYNELGQVQTKLISPTGGANGTPLETQNFAYNIQGGLVSINGDFVTNANSTSFFGEIISYEYGFTNTQANGAISGVRWKAAGDGIARAYGYSYDNANRLTVADFNQQNQGSTAWTKNTVDYTVNNLSYDANGNILSMKQRGLLLTSSATIDSLSYQYFANTNQLQKVSDGITDLTPRGDFKDTTTTVDDYAYDANGNIIKDLNRHMHNSAGAAGAVFNVLDKPDSIVVNGKSRTRYFYDAGGSLIRKVITNLKTNTLTTYLYIGAFVYKNDTLQSVFTEEGQIRQSSVVGYAFDYFIKDHQGNIRTILTDANENYYYTASMEPSLQAREDALFTNIYTPVNTVLAKPTGFDALIRNTKVSRLNGNTAINKKTGPGIVLKVMAGDKLLINTYAWYNTAAQPPLSGVNILSEVVSTLTGGVINNSAGKLNSGNNTAISGVFNQTSNVPNFLNNNRPYDNTRPKAFINWIVVDNQFNMVSSVSSAMQVVAGSSKQALVAPTITIPKNGYVYVFVSNESPQDVYFDDVTIQHLAGPLVQEQSYYPYGLPMYAINDRAALKPNTPYKYNAGSELEEEGLDYYNTFYRKYDAQIGRFTGVDILAERTINLTPYQYAGNNPVMFNDPTGALLNGDGSIKHLTNWGSQGGSPMWMDGILNSGGAWDIQESWANGGHGPISYPSDYDDYSGFWSNLWKSVPNGKNAFFDGFGSKSGTFKGNDGQWFSFSYSLDNGTYLGFGKNNIIGEVILGTYFVNNARGGFSSWAGFGPTMMQTGWPSTPREDQFMQPFYDAYNWIKQHLVFEVSAKVTVGTQAKLQLGAIGGGAGTNVVELVGGKLDLVTMSTTRTDKEKRIHSYIEGNVGIKKTPISVGSSYNSSYEYYDGYYGPQKIEGTEKSEWGGIDIGPARIFPSHNSEAFINPVANITGSNNFKGINLGVGAAIVFGIDINLKIGIK